MTDDDIVYEEVPSPAPERSVPSFDPWGVVCILLLAAAAIEILTGVVNGLVFRPERPSGAFLTTPLSFTGVTLRQRLAFFAGGANIATGLSLVVATFIAADRRPRNSQLILQLVVLVSGVVVLLAVVGLINTTTTPGFFRRERFGFLLTPISAFVTSGSLASMTAWFALRQSSDE